MTSPYAPPDRPALEELDRLLRALEEELGLRKGAGPRTESEPAAKVRVADMHQARQRIGLLEGENQLLRQRIAAAREQVEQLRTRLRFIEDRGAGDSA